MNYEYIFAHLTIILTLAATSGILVGKLKQPIMIGYIIAGVLIGPSCFGLVASQEQVHFYSELGILLLLFVIGMELNIKSFLKMWKIPTLFTVIQVLGSALLAVLLSNVFGFSVYVSLLTAFFTCLSSTAAIVKVLEYLGESKTDVGHITIGILVAQDIVVVPMMLIIKECGKPLGMSIVLELAFAIGLVVFMLKYLGKKEQIVLPTNHLIPNNELVPVVTLASVFIAATLVTLFGLSEAYGAFLAGLFIGNTQARQSVLNSIKPIQSVLLMVFFLSVGLMFDLKFLFQNWFIVLISLILVTTWKIFFNAIILRMFSIELAKATSIGIILAQLGEFSLVLATVATQSGIIGVYGQKLIVCITALSLSISPLFIVLSKKTRNLSFTGDNSANSIIKVIFSGRFSRLAGVLFHKAKNNVKNIIVQIKSRRIKEEQVPAILNSTIPDNSTTDNVDNTLQANNVQNNVVDASDDARENRVEQNNNTSVDSISKNDHNILIETHSEQALDINGNTDETAIPNTATQEINNGEIKIQDTTEDVSSNIEQKEDIKSNSSNNTTEFNNDDNYIISGESKNNNIDNLSMKISHNNEPLDGINNNKILSNITVSNNSEQYEPGSNKEELQDNNLEDSNIASNNTVEPEYKENHIIEKLEENQYDINNTFHGDITSDNQEVNINSEKQDAILDDKSENNKEDKKKSKKNRRLFRKK
ncbi:MAG: cation:proton antiporter [Alphaproteobacteria bacterium]|nr:cation:proton antiporter [Alphaproteobacteria bacterium]